MISSVSMVILLRLVVIPLFIIASPSGQHLELARSPWKDHLCLFWKFPRWEKRRSSSNCSERALEKTETLLQILQMLPLIMSLELPHFAVVKGLLMEIMITLCSRRSH
ncbi:hypothetical protein Goari_025142 [Gossypium aridum]|uniref:Secreted protein n=1 Tax=Gossypium aridum TaxID=34290 RepID=A0A7J8X869_GOSAI|nr:hypothetical protein [Gossypium aridum]